MPAFALVHPVSPREAVVPEDIHADVWHAHTLAQSAGQVVSTGEALLDAQLPGGGWPVGPAEHERVPVVPAAILFDLWVGDPRIRPDAHALCSGVRSRRARVHPNF